MQKTESDDVSQVEFLGFAFLDESITLVYKRQCEASEIVAELQHQIFMGSVGLISLYDGQINVLP